MLVNIDKRGRVKLPAAVRKELGLEPGTLLQLTVLEGGHLSLAPVAVYPTVTLSEHGLAKLKEARRSGVEQMPEWLRKEVEESLLHPQ